MQTQSTVTGTRELPKFDQIIKIEVPVDMIYRKMLDTLPLDYAHRETLAHAIVGSTISHGKIAYIYNALAGFTNDIDYKVGDVVMCSAAIRREKYDYNIENDKGEPKPDGIEIKERDGSAYKPNWSMRDVVIGECKIVEIDLYSTDKLRVEYMEDAKYNDRQEMTSDWVALNTCEKVMLYPQPAAKKAARVEVVENVNK